MKRAAWSGYPQTTFCLAKLTKQGPFLRNEVLSKLREHCSWSLSRRQLSALAQEEEFQIELYQVCSVGRRQLWARLQVWESKQITHKEWKRASISVLSDEALPPAMKSQMLPRLLISWNSVLQSHYISLPFCLRSQK